MGGSAPGAISAGHACGLTKLLHKGSRIPCMHVLAAEIAVRGVHFVTTAASAPAFSAHISAGAWDFGTFISCSFLIAVSISLGVCLGEAGSYPAEGGLSHLSESVSVCSAETYVRAASRAALASAERLSASSCSTILSLTCSSRSCERVGW